MKKIIYTFCLFTSLVANHFSLLTLNAQPVTQEWVRRYNNTYNLNDIPVALAVDKWGNSYVTGYCFTTGVKEIATVKYNPQGVQQWAKIYCDVSMPEIFALGIAVDTSGNACITGWSGNINTNIYYAWVIKYNSNGDSLWSRKYNGMEQYVFPSAISTDKFNNVYITGTDYSSVQPDQTFTIKYNSNGDTLWTRNHRETGYSGNGSSSIAIDGTGNVIIGGVSWFSSSKYDFLVVKYNSSGTKQWTKTYGEQTYNEFAYRIAVDRNSNVCITGYGYNTNTLDYYDYLTIKYNSGGDLQWARMYSRGVDEANDVTFDYSGNVIVTGKSSFPGNGYDYCTIKYNSSGDSQWVRIYNGAASLEDIAYYVLTDSSNNVYVTGNSRFVTNNGNLTTIKYSSNGVQQWFMQYIGGMQGGINRGQCISLDYLRNIFVIGSNSENGTGGDYITIKYTQPVGLESASNTVPFDFNLYQNYPNPFNPHTKIKFDIAPDSRLRGNDNIILKIFDILGREIAVLVNEKLKPGAYEIDWNGSNNPSGVYFYSLTIGDFTETKKMVLIK